MITVNSCANKSCANNEDGKCACFWGIEIDSFGECVSIEFKKENDEDAESKRDAKQ